MNLKQAAILAVVKLETKFHFDRDHDGAHTLTQTDCVSARASVDAAIDLLPSIIHGGLIARVNDAQRWLTVREARG